MPAPLVETVKAPELDLSPTPAQMSVTYYPDLITTVSE